MSDAVCQKTAEELFAELQRYRTAEERQRLTVVIGEEILGRDLSSLDFEGAMLREVAIDDCDMRSCDLSNAFFEGFSMARCDLRGADLPTWGTILTDWEWYHVTDNDLVVRMMRHDMANHPNGREAFDDWVQNETCPFGAMALPSGGAVSVPRAVVHFHENLDEVRAMGMEEFAAMRVPTALELVRDLFAASDIRYFGPDGKPEDPRADIRRRGLGGAKALRDLGVFNPAARHPLPSVVTALTDRIIRLRQAIERYLERPGCNAPQRKAALERLTWSLTQDGRGDDGSR